MLAPFSSWGNSILGTRTNWPKSSSWEVVGIGFKPRHFRFPGGSDSKESACNSGNLGLIPGLGRSPGEGKGYPLQYSGLENSMDSPWGCKESDTTDWLSLFISSAFSKSSLNIWKFLVYVLLRPGLENFEHYFASMWDECNCAVIWTFFGNAFLWDWNEDWHFPVLWPLLIFPNLLAYWVQHFHSIIF